MESPALCDRVESLRWLESAIKKGPKKEDLHQLQNMIAKEKQELSSPNAMMGRVVIASGLRSNSSRRRMDWAFFSAAATFQPNRVPPYKILFQAPPLFPRDENFVVTKFGKLAKDDWVAKVGRGSMLTTGQVNLMERYVNWTEHGIESWEVEVIGSIGPFAVPGDSGSMVFNGKGELVGLLIGTEATVNTRDSGFRHTN